MSKYLICYSISGYPNAVQYYPSIFELFFVHFALYIKPIQQIANIIVTYILILSSVAFTKITTYQSSHRIL